MRICHFSDWHGKVEELPAADVYVCSGDMIPNFPIMEQLVGRDTVLWDPNVFMLGWNDMLYPGAVGKNPGGVNMRRIIEPEREARLQKMWIEVLGSYREFFANPDAPVVCVRGNHDFTDLAPAFGGDVWEVWEEPFRTTMIGGLKFGGCRGIRHIIGEWSDEFHERDQHTPYVSVRPPLGPFEDVVRKIPEDLDVLVTHSPPNGVRDLYFNESIGSNALWNGYINLRLYGSGNLKAHCFGHIHESHGLSEIEGIKFSNAATTHNVFDI